MKFDQITQVNKNSFYIFYENIFLRIKRSINF